NGQPYGLTDPPSGRRGQAAGPVLFAILTSAFLLKVRLDRTVSSSWQVWGLIQPSGSWAQSHASPAKRAMPTLGLRGSDASGLTWITKSATARRSASKSFVPDASILPVVS